MTTAIQERRPTRKATRRRAGSRTRARRPRLDPVTAYATDVVEGRILAGRAVRLACARHLRDLQRQATAAFPYRFDVAEAQRLFDFFEDFLVIEARPFVLLPWQKFVVGSLFGWRNAEGYRRFQIGYCETSKGTGKTPLAAGIGLYGLVGDGEIDAEIYSLGVTRDQSTYLYKYAKRMAEESDDIAQLLDIGEHNMAWLDTHSYMRPLSSEGRSLDNKKPHIALIDELHEHPSPVVVDKMRLGFKGRRQPILFEITNSGHDQTSVCWQHHDLSLKVLEGVIVDEQWFAYVCQLDVCDACREKGLTQPDETCATCDHWTDERVWPKACPSLGVTLQVAYLRGVVKEALNMPSKQGIVKRLNFCLWTQAHTVWIVSDRWEACRVEALSESVGLPCAAAFDMSMKWDLTSCVVALRIDRPKEEQAEDVEIDDNVEGETVRKIWSVNYDIEIIPFFWLPEDTLLERVRDERIPYDVWRAGKHLRVTKGPVIDHHDIHDQFVSEIGKRYRPQRIGYDPYNATELAVGLRDRAKYTVVEIGQGRKLSEYVKLFDALVRMRRIRHTGNPVMGWCVSNAAPKFDRYQNMWLEKPSGGKRIDGAVAAVMAVSQVVLLPRKRPMARRARVWTSAGFVDAPGATDPGATV